MTVQVVTANRLRDGVIVWLTAQNTWSEEFLESKPLRDEAEAKAGARCRGNRRESPAGGWPLSRRGR